MKVNKTFIKEVSNPVEGQYTLDNLGNLVVYKSGNWIDVSKLTVSTSAFYDFQ